MSSSTTKAKARASISLSLDWDNIFKKVAPSSVGRAGSSITFSKSTVNFCTGSSYTGKWNMLGMSHHGTYRFPYSCEYSGEFEDGMFHGRGVLKYPMGQKLVGYWKKGKMLSYKFHFIDGMVDDKQYVQMADRRFLIEMREDLQPAGREFITNSYTAREIPENCYDTCDGFYNVDSDCLWVARDQEELMNDVSRESLDLTNIGGDRSSIFWVNMLVMVSKKRKEWIKAHCRKAWDEPVGYKPEFYEDWISGRSEELQQLREKYETIKFSKEKLPEREEKEERVERENMVTPTTVYAGTGRMLTPGSKMELFSESFCWLDDD